MDDAEVAFVGLHDRRAALHPIAAVQVVDAAEATVRGMVDVPANDALDPTPDCLDGDRLLECADEGDRPLHPILQIGRQRPVAEAEVAAEPIERIVEPQGELVASVAEHGEPSRGAHDHVELVAVQYEIAPPIRGDVHDIPVDLYAAE